MHPHKLNIAVDRMDPQFITVVWGVERFAPDLLAESESWVSRTSLFLKLESYPVGD
jgi:hypothetical protein